MEVCFLGLNGFPGLAGLDGFGCFGCRNLRWRAGWRNRAPHASYFVRGHGLFCHKNILLEIPIRSIIRR